MTWDHITVMMDRPGEIWGCLSGQVDLSPAARCIIVLPPGIIANAGRADPVMFPHRPLAVAITIPGRQVVIELPGARMSVWSGHRLNR